MPSDRKARSPAFGAYTFLTADKKYSFARATQLRGKVALGLFAGARFDEATGIAALLKIVAPMSPSASGGRSPDGEDTVATKSRSLPRRVNSLSAAANPLDPAKPAFSVRRPAAHLGTACFTVAPMSPSATGGRPSTVGTPSLHISQLPSAAQWQRQPAPRRKLSNN